MPPYPPSCVPPGSAVLAGLLDVGYADTSDVPCDTTMDATGSIYLTYLGCPSDVHVVHVVYGAAHLHRSTLQGTSMMKGERHCVTSSGWVVQ
jgi:hypothetical protein